MTIGISGLGGVRSNSPELDHHITDRPEREKDITTEKKYLHFQPSIFDRTKKKTLGLHVPIAEKV